MEQIDWALAQNEEERVQQFEVFGESEEPQEEEAVTLVQMIRGHAHEHEKSIFLQEFSDRHQNANEHRDRQNSQKEVPQHEGRSESKGSARAHQGWSHKDHRPVENDSHSRQAPRVIVNNRLVLCIEMEHKVRGFRQCGR